MILRSTVATLNGVVFLLHGYTQQHGHDTGLGRLWTGLLEGRDRLCLPGVGILPREWDDDVVAMAQLVKRQVKPDGCVIVVGYSYGGGWTSPKLAGQLARVGRHVDLMLLIDPVWRYRYLSLKWLSLSGRIPIEIPANVRRVASWRQRGGGLFDPKGSPLKLDDAGSTKVLHDLDVTGPEMDHQRVQYETGILEQCYDRIMEQLVESCR